MISKILNRLSQNSLEDFLGSKVIEIILGLKGSPLTKTEIIDLISKQSDGSFDYLLQNNKFREYLLNALRPEEAKILYTYIFGNSLDINHYQGFENSLNNNIDIEISEKSFQESEYQLDNFYEALINITTGLNLKKLIYLFTSQAGDSFNEFKNKSMVISDKNFDGTYNFHTKIKPAYTLFDHQIKVANEVRDYIHSIKPRVLIHMPTGAGKTRTAMHIICDYLNNYKKENKLIIWVADKKELCEQASEEFEQAASLLCNSEGINLYRNYSKTAKSYKLSELKSGLFVTTIQLLTKKIRSDSGYLIDLANKSMLMVFDEAHHIMATQYQLVSDLISSEASQRPIIGLTATPGRDYNNPQADLDLRDFFYRQKVNLKVNGYDNPIHYLQAQGYLAKTEELPIYYNAGKKFSSEEQQRIKKEVYSGKPLSKVLYDQITNDKDRMLLLLKVIKKEAENEENLIMVFAPNVEQSEALANVLNVEGIRAASITGKTQEKVRFKNIELFKKGKIKILINYDVLTAGFDAPKANVAIIGRPTESIIAISQMVGRVMRGPKQGGTDKCKVLSVIDKAYGFEDAAERFLAWEDIW